MPEFTLKSLIVPVLAGAAGGAVTGLGAAAGLTPPSSVWPVVATCAVLGALVHNAKHALAEMVDNRTRTLRDRLEQLQRYMGDVHGLVRLLPYTKDLPLPIGGGWALTGDSAAILVREAQLRKPRALLELGSGVSTLLLGQLLRSRGEGHLLSIDHDPEWAGRTRKNLAFLGLSDHVTVVVAPLARVDVGGQAFDWYDIPAEQLDLLGPIDLLLVDGPPPARHQELGARYPALPLLRHRLSSNALIFVDDASRPAETAMVKQWLVEDPSWAADRHDTVDGVCLLSRTTEPPR